MIRFRPQGGADGFYNPNGESVVRAFLRTPMDASKISSRFGMREHPILGYSALHAGVDFAAPSGTPILAAGAGKVVDGRPQRRLRPLREAAAHAATSAPAYAHMSRLGPGIKPGVARAPGPGDRLRRLDRHVDRPAPALRVPSRRQAVNPLAQKFAMRAQVGGKDAARFQGWRSSTSRSSRTRRLWPTPSRSPRTRRRSRRAIDDADQTARHPGANDGLPPTSPA